MEYIKNIDFKNRVEREQRHRTEFAAACVQFRELCVRIAEFLGTQFYGGFDEYAAFAQSAAYRADPTTGNTLAVMLAGANEHCKYVGGKCGYGQPEWWHECWSKADNDVHV